VVDTGVNKRTGWNIIAENNFVGLAIFLMKRDRHAWCRQTILPRVGGLLVHHAIGGSRTHGRSHACDGLLIRGVGSGPSNGPLAILLLKSDGWSVFPSNIHAGYGSGGNIDQRRT